VPGGPDPPPAPGNCGPGLSLTVFPFSSSVAAPSALSMWSATCSATSRLYWSPPSFSLANSSAPIAPSQFPALPSSSAASRTTLTSCQISFSLIAPPSTKDASTITWEFSRLASEAPTVQSSGPNSHACATISPPSEAPSGTAKSRNLIWLINIWISVLTTSMARFTFEKNTASGLAPDESSYPNGEAHT